MLFALALIPVVALLIFIYLKDKKEKEPIGLLIGLFFAGMATSITAIIGEAIGQAILNAVFYYESILKALILAIFIVGPAEELGKYLVLRLITWKSKHYNYSYDAIVYAVFVSLGFACIENVGYVFSSGLSTALLRMFTAVPGHACFAVFMGYFYSKAKYAQVTNNKSAYTSNLILSMVAPILVHGFYDGILFAGRSSGEDVITGLAVLLWIGYVIAMFVVSFIIVFKASKNDFCIITLPGEVQTVYKPSIVGSWTCSCGTINYLNFCGQCGKQRPIDTTWTCPTCGTLCAFNFCGKCGCAKPSSSAQPAAAQAPVTTIAAPSSNIE